MQSGARVNRGVVVLFDCGAWPRLQGEVAAAWGGTAACGAHGRRGAAALRPFLVVPHHKWTAQFEHTLVVTEDGYEILTLP